MLGKNEFTRRMVKHFPPYEEVFADKPCLAGMRQTLFRALGANSKDVEKGGVLRAPSGASINLASFGNAMMLGLELG